MSLDDIKTLRRWHRDAALRAKRAECRAKAKAEKVSLFKRPAYVKTCMSQT